MVQAQRVPALVLTVLAALVAASTFFVQPATAAGTGTISGTVTLAGATGKHMYTYGQIQVLNGSTWTRVGDDGVYADYVTGHYQTEPLLPGTYRIEFTNMDYRTQVSGPVDITADTTAVVDITLDPGANIRGHFTIPDGGPAVDGNVHVMESSSSGYWVEVDNGFMEPDGTYYVSGLAGGKYKVWFGDFKHYYATEYYDNVATIDQAQVLSIPPGGSATDIDVLMSHEALPVPPPPAPVPTSVSVSRAPRVVGIMRVGQRVRAKIGTVTPATATVRYAWFMDGRRIKKATSAHLRLKRVLVGRRVGVRVTVTAPGLDRWRSVSRAKMVRSARSG